MGENRKGARAPQVRRVRLKEFARYARYLPTRGEHAMWNRLRRRQLCGVKFRRQAIIGPFIADFYAPELRLVVEVDGPVHDERDVRERDARRQRWMEELNLSFFRVSADEAEHETDRCISRLADEIFRLRRERCPESPALL